MTDKPDLSRLSRAKLIEMIEAGRELHHELSELISTADYNADELGQGVDAWAPVARTMGNGTMAAYRMELWPGDTLEGWQSRRDAATMANRIGHVEAARAPMDEDAHQAPEDAAKTVLGALIGGKGKTKQ